MREDEKRVVQALTNKESEKTHIRFFLSAMYPAKLGVIAAANAPKVPIRPRSKNVAPKDWAKTGMKYVYIPDPSDATNTER